MLLRACVYPSPDIKGHFVAHCLELDLIGEGKTPKKAIVELIQAIEIQIEACESPSQFFFPAPASVWQRFKQAHTAGRVIMQRIVDQALAFKQIPANYVPLFQNMSMVATNAVPERYIQTVTSL